MNCCKTMVQSDYYHVFHSITGNMVSEMMRVVPGDSISQTFIRQMIPHHQAAIDMSRNLLEYTKDERLRSIAQNIISSQTRSIKDMEAAYEKCGCYTDCENNVLSYQENFQKAVSTMFCRMSWAQQTGNISCDFLYEMIPHHEGAIAMSENALDYAICPELIPILKAIITSQCQGVREMQALKKCLC